MPNTFKVKTKASVPASLTTIYTVGSSTTAVVLGLALCNKTSSAITASVQLVTDTSDTETNTTVMLLNTVSIPASTTLEFFGGQKVVAQTTDVIKVLASTTSALDATLSIMEIT